MSDFWQTPIISENLNQIFIFFCFYVKSILLSH